MDNQKQEVVLEWGRCEASFVEFLRHVRIRDATKGVISLELWPHVVQIAKDWQKGDSWIEGKARQQGLSWLLAGFDLWTLMFHEQARILSISMGERESIELLEKVKFIHAHLPDHLRMELGNSNREIFTLKANGSSMRALPSTENAGRSFQATLVQFDEFAFHPYAGANYDSTRAAIADGGQMLIVSTGNGPTNMFASLWEDDGVPFKKRFTSWRGRPDRDQEWYAHERSAYLSRGRVMLFNRENPETIEEMFAAFQGLVYSEFTEARHVRAPSFNWEDAKFRVAGIDPGQGDPFAIIPIGQDENGFAYQFDEFYEQDRVAYGTVIDYLMMWHSRAPFNAIYVDGTEGTLIATLRASGLPAYAANKERKMGISLVQSRLEANNYAIAPHCDNTVREYKTYRFATRTAAGEADPYTTATPVDHHGDAMDGTRYALMGLSLGFAVSTPGGMPNFSATGELTPKSMVVVNPDGTMHDSRKGPGAVHTPARRGPDYRMSRRARMRR